MAALPSRELVIGTKEAPPFASKKADGTWTGISIDLWRRIATTLGVRFRFKEETLGDLIDDTAAGRLDGAIAAITVTAAREERLDFSQPYIMTGLGIATRGRGASGMWSLVRAVLSFGFVQAILGLATLLFGVGFLLWLAERRRNAQFGGSAARGLGSAFWWSAVTMTTVGYGDKAPTTAAGRLIAIGWMFASVIIISGVTAGITTALTTAQLKGVVAGPKDLGSVRVGSISGSSSADYLDGEHIVFTNFTSVDPGLKALQSGSIDAFVYDRPLLLYAVKPSSSSLTVLPAVFDRQNYAIALPNGSPLREPIDRALLAAIQSDWWTDTTFRYLGEK